MDPIQPRPNETQYQTSAPETLHTIPLAFRDDDVFSDEIVTTESDEVEN